MTVRDGGKVMDMKLIGRRSVASVLRWVLGFINVFVLIGVVTIGIALLLSLIAPEAMAVFVDEVADRRDTLAEDGLLVTVWMTFLGRFLILGGTWWALSRLRRIFRSVNHGDAFEPANVGRLQGIGLGLIGIAVGTGLLAYYAPGSALSDGGGVNVGSILGILIVFMLAEVFRQGAAMRDDQQMTV